MAASWVRSLSLTGVQGPALTPVPEEEEEEEEGAPFRT